MLLLVSHEDVSPTGDGARQGRRPQEEVGISFIYSSLAWLLPLLSSSSPTPVVPLPPPRPLRSLPLNTLTLPPRVLLLIPTDTPDGTDTTDTPLPMLMLPDTLMPLLDSSPTPMVPLSPLSPQMSSLPAKNIWLPMLPLKKQENQLVM